VIRLVYITFVFIVAIAKTYIAAMMSLQQKLKTTII